MVYELPANTYGNRQNFNGMEFLETIGDTAQDFIEGVGTNFDANAMNAVAMANLNQAQADAIKSNAENKRQITKSIFVVLIVAIIGLVIVSLASKFWK